VVNFARLSDLLHNELDAEIFLTEGPMDHDVIEHLINIIKVPFIRVRNKTVSFIAGLLKEMDMVVTNDTGIMHLSAAVGTPTLSLFGPTDPLQWAPLGSKHRFILGRGGDINTIEVTKAFSSASKLLRKS
jgi:ADP-heptose:LPS heptosyltransferase